MVASPYDPDVHYAKKRATSWVGYKVHLTETCDDDRPPLITHVTTTPAPVVDRAALAPLHAALATKDLLPARHFVDAAYIDADQLVAGVRDHAVTLVGPVPKDNQWQARTQGALTIAQFTFNWDRRVATCPAGHTSESWSDEHNQGRTVMRVRFSTRDCKACSLKPRCTRSARRLLTPRRREEHEALVAARAKGGGPGLRGRAAPTGRDRGHALAGRARHGPAAGALSRHRQDAPAAPDHGSRDQPRASGRLDR
jgi:transposase